MASGALDTSQLFRQSVLPAIYSALQQVFRAADVAIIQMAMNAGDNAGQNRHFEAVQGLRIVQPELIDHFLQRLLQPFSGAFAEAAVPVDAEHVNSLRKLLSVPVDAWCADTALAAATWDLQQRLATLAPGLGNPLDPEHVVDCFLQSLGEARMDIKTKMLMLRMFEGHLYNRIERYVRMANDALAAEGILPDLQTQPSMTEASLNALVSEVTGQEADADLHEAACQLEHALADVQALDVENIDKMLDPSLVLEASTKPVVIRDMLGELSSHGLLPAIAAQKLQLLHDQLVLVDRLFQYIVEDNNLPPEARVVLRYLQLPYARIALVDAGLLQNNKHPAKVLLNQVMEVCAGWQPDCQALANDELFRMLSGTIQAFLETERMETLNYREMTFDYLAYGEAQRQKNEQATRRLLDSQVGADVADAIRDTVSNLIEKKMAGRKIPDAARRMLSEGWNHLLYIIALKQGLASAEWQQALAVVDQLLQSVQPASAYPSRSAFILQLPPLLRQLRLGLCSIDLSLVLINQLLEDLEAEHKKIVCAIQGDFSDLEKVVIRRHDPAVSGTIGLKDEPGLEPRKYTVRSSIVFTPEQLQELALEAVEVVKANAKDIFSDTTRKIMEKIGPGVSLLWNQPGGQKRCRVAAHIKHAKKFIITDRSGGKLAEMSEFDLAQKIDNGEMEVMVDEALFDRALESVIGNIRDRR